MRLEPGTRLGPFEIVAALGAGGMGEVYRARDSRLERDVAIKVLPEHLAGDTDARARFEREAKAVAALSHPNILALHDVGEESGVHYAVTELLVGETVRERIRRGPIAWREAAQIGAAVAEGLAAAHVKGIVHRDLKPENIFLTQDGRVKLLDFGLAVLQPTTVASGVATASQITRHGSVIGTMGYMAPEQLRGERVTPATDVFAFGCVLAEMLSGRAPFARATPAECIAAVLAEESVDPPALSGRNAPPALAQLVRRALAKSPDERPKDGREMALALRALTEPGRRTSVRRAAFWTVAGAVLAVGTALVADLGGWRTELGLVTRKPMSSLAVLPLEDLSGQPQRDFFANGLTDALNADLAMLPDVRVISRASVMRYKGKAVPASQVGRELGVEGVVKASVTPGGGRTVISAQLIEASTERVLWSQTYDRDARDVQAVQREISRAVAHGIRARLTPKQDARLRDARPMDPQLYETFLRGSFHCGRAGGQQQGMELLEATIARDPTYAPAYAALGTCYHYDAFFFERIPAREAYGRAKAAALEALKLDPEMGEAHAVLAQARLHHDWDFAGAERDFARALELSPGSAEIHHWYAHYLLAMGRAEESVMETRRAFELNPLNAGLAACIGWHCFFARQYDEAIANTRRALELSPDSYMAHYYLAWAYEKKGDFEPGIAAMQRAVALNGRPASLASLARLYARAGRRAEAEKTLAALVEMAGKRHVPAYDMAVAYAGVGQGDRAFEWLDRAYDERSAMIVHVNWDPRFEELRSDPRFFALVRRLGLPT